MKNINEMSYTEIASVIPEVAHELHFDTRVNKCQAWYSEVVADRYVFLKSYNTVVALYDCLKHNLISFGRYSMTTYQHIRKFREKMWEEHCDKLHYRPWDIAESNLNLVNWF